MPDAKSLTDKIVHLVQYYFDGAGDDAVAVVEMTGARNSAVAAAVCAKALGSNRVIGVVMPNLIQHTEDAISACDAIGIARHTIPVTVASASIYYQIRSSNISISDKAMVDLPVLVRQAVLHTVAKSMNGMVVGSSNIVRRCSGFCLQPEDNSVPIEILSGISQHDILSIGNELGVPAKFLDRPEGIFPDPFSADKEH